MTQTVDFLVEIGTEELPPKALKKLSQAFGAGIEAGLAEAELSFGEVRYASPRRLAVRIQELQARQADKTVEKKAAKKPRLMPTVTQQSVARFCARLRS
ncbi:Glycine--tRNA ligase beta subunit (modular protein) [uncultured Thiomicrorhabdus sp.]